MNSLTNFLKVLHKLRKKNSLKLIYYTKQSQNKKYFCFISALKSPHVNKKAQEQFEFNLYSKQLKIKVSQINKFLFV